MGYMATGPGLIQSLKFRMRYTLCACMKVRVLPAREIPKHDLILPKISTSKSKSTAKRGSPTAALMVRRAQAQQRPLPPNLRIEEYVPPRQLYEGVAEGDRELVSLNDEPRCRLALTISDATSSRSSTENDRDWVCSRAAMTVTDVHKCCLYDTSCL